MQISPAAGMLIMFNNYAHDVATALLAASAFTMRAVIKVQVEMDTPAAALFFLKSYRIMRKFFKISLWWIIIGGIPRTIFYKSFEWANAVDKLQVPALVFKHILLSCLVIWGIIAWRRLNRKVNLLREALPGDLRAQL